MTKAGSRDLWPCNRTPNGPHAAYQACILCASAGATSVLQIIPLSKGQALQLQHQHTCMRCIVSRRLPLPHAARKRNGLTRNRPEP